jgi:hypothetical protein
MPFPNMRSGKDVRVQSGGVDTVRHRFWQERDCQLVQSYNGLLLCARYGLLGESGG